MLMTITCLQCGSTFVIEDDFGGKEKLTRQLTPWFKVHLRLHVQSKTVSADIAADVAPEFN